MADSKIINDATYESAGKEYIEYLEWENCQKKK